MKLEPEWSTMKRPYVFKRISFELRTNISLADYFIKGAEILEVLHSLPAVRQYLFSLYECRYAAFFQSLGKAILFLIRAFQAL